MTTPTKKSWNSPTLPRRELMKAAAGLAMLPSASAFARILTPVRAPATLTVAVGLLGASQTSGSSIAYVDAAFEPGTYELRVLSASTDAPLSIDAQYPQGNEHHFWQAWNEGNLLQHSPPSRIRWSADDGSSLPLLVWYGGSSVLGSVAPQAGTYAMVVAAPGKSQPLWSTLELSGGDVNGAGATLMSSGVALSLPYFVFSVQALAS